MDLLLRLGVSIALVTALVVGVSVTQPEWAVSIGLDFWKFPEFNKAYAEQLENSAQLDEKMINIMNTAKKTEHWVKEVIDQKRSLKEAASLVRQSREWEDLDRLMNQLGIERTNTQADTARLVIYWVTCQLRMQPQLLRRTTARLEKELASLQQGQ